MCLFPNPLVRDLGHPALRIHTAVSRYRQAAAYRGANNRDRMESVFVPDTP